MEPNNELTEIVIGAPKCRNFSQTGKKFEARPLLPFSPDAAYSLPWHWFPWKVRIWIPFLLRILAGISAAVSLTVFGAQILIRRALAWSALIFINLFFKTPMLYLAHIMNFNFKLRGGICWCKGKALQAVEEWKNTTDPSRAKEVFFEWKCSAGLVLKVLNDGSQECWNLGGDELAEELSKALGLGNFTGKEDGRFMGSVIGDDGFVGVAVADSAVKDKSKDRPDRAAQDDSDA